MHPVALITHPDCAAHDPGAGHPEAPARLRAVMTALDHPDFAELRRETASEASIDQLTAVHASRYVQAVLRLAPREGEILSLDSDTFVGPGSVRAALLAAGGVIAGVDAVMRGQAEAAFVAVRPPGHHAESARAMGFCLFNSVAVAAQHARARWGLTRIAVVDFDVHHGNGTQAMFHADPGLFYASSHQSPCYPGTGHAHETGIARNIVNLPLPPGAGGAAFRQVWEGKGIPALLAFRPELLILSAGFDAHRADPLAQLCLETEDFGWITDRLVQTADASCGGRVVSALEGGYDLAALAACTALHVCRLMRR